LVAYKREYDVIVTVDFLEVQLAHQGREARREIKRYSWQNSGKSDQMKIPSSDSVAAVSS